MSVFKSSGADGIYSYHRNLKKLKNKLVELLATILNKSLGNKIVSNIFKLIFKRANKSKFANYQPINFTSVVRKLLESIIAIICHNFKKGV